MHASIIFLHEYMDAELAGVDVFGITAIVITNSSLEWQWEGYGLKIHVGENTLPLGIEQCPVNINASLTGHYEFPEDEYLVSAIFWFRCELPCRFAKPISLEIQHCACSHNSLRLSFVKAKCIQEQLPYKFKSIDSGSFSGHSSYGIIEVNSFSAFGVTQKGSGERNYLANVLYIEERLSLDLRFHLYFVVTWNTVIHDRVSKWIHAVVSSDIYITITGGKESFQKGKSVYRTVCWN